MGALADNEPPPSAPRWIKDPAGWEPGATLGATGGTIVGRSSTPIAPDQWDEFLAELLPPGFDPAEYAVVGDTVQVRSWDVNLGDGQVQRLYYWRAQITRRQPAHLADVDLVALREKASKRPAVRNRTGMGDGFALVVHLSDWQLGKGENGGTAATIDRIHAGLDAAFERARQEKPESVVLAGLGDLVEGCTGHYPDQTFTADLDDREQMRVATRLVLTALDRFVGWPTTLTACVSNHGEKRQGGKPITGPLDSKDLELLDRVADVVAASPRYGNVRLLGPDKTDPCVTRIDVHGVKVATTHGHVGFKGANAAAAAEGWLVGQIKGQRPAADAEVILCGHRHHFMCVELGLRRTVVQAPSLDGGSTWFSSATGAQSHPGLLTSLCGDAIGRSGIGHYVIH